MRILSQLLVGSDVVQLDRGIIRARAESCPLREELQKEKYVSQAAAIFTCSIETNRVPNVAIMVVVTGHQ